MAIHDTTVTAEPREVTDDEVSFFTENGWLKLDEFVDPASAAALLETGQSLMQKGKDQDAMKEANLQAWWSSRRRVATDDKAEPFRSFLLSQNLGKAAYNLMNRSRLTDRVVPVMLRIGDPHLQGPGWHAREPGNAVSPGLSRIAVRSGGVGEHLGRPKRHSCRARVDALSFRFPPRRSTWADGARRLR